MNRRLVGAVLAAAAVGAVAVSPAIATRTDTPPAATAAAVILAVGQPDIQMKIDPSHSWAADAGYLPGDRNPLQYGFPPGIQVVAWERAPDTTAEFTDTGGVIFHEHTAGSSSTPISYQTPAAHVSGHHSLAVRRGQHVKRTTEGSQYGCSSVVRVPPTIFEIHGNVFSLRADTQYSGCFNLFETEALLVLTKDLGYHNSSDDFHVGNANWDAMVEGACTHTSVSHSWRNYTTSTYTEACCGGGVAVFGAQSTNTNIFCA